jgi:hypothetical protein
MGFHKRYISENNLRSVFKVSGAEGVLRTFSADAVILDDSFSSEVNDIVSEYYDHRNKERLVEEINKKFETC